MHWNTIEEGCYRVASKLECKNQLNLLASFDLNKKKQLAHNEIQHDTTTAKISRAVVVDGLDGTVPRCAESKFSPSSPACVCSVPSSSPSPEGVPPRRWWDASDSVGPWRCSHDLICARPTKWKGHVNPTSIGVLLCATNESKMAN